MTESTLLLRLSRRTPSFIGETVLFSVVVQNTGATRIRVQGIEVVPVLSVGA